MEQCGKCWAFYIQGYGAPCPTGCGPAQTIQVGDKITAISGFLRRWQKDHPRFDNKPSDYTWTGIVTWIEDSRFGLDSFGNDCDHLLMDGDLTITKLD
jgi:hypothetical protein